MTTTSDIYTAAESITPDEIKVRNIVPGGMCPGHFDLTTDEAGMIASTDLILSHGWESWLDKIREINPEVKIIELKTEGNWMIPYIYRKGTDEIYRSIQMYIDSSSILNKKLYSKYITYILEIDSIQKFYLESRSSFNDIEIISNEFIEDFLEGLGFRVISVYSPGDEINAREIKETITKGRENEVSIVVDNLQSGIKVGRMIAENLNASHVVITNFPENNDYEGTLKSNIESLKRAIIDKP